MARRQKYPLRVLTNEERTLLVDISRSRSEPVVHVERAKLILAVADGASYTAAAHALGRRSNDAVSRLVQRFNHEGLAALAPKQGGGAPIQYGPTERERVLREFHRTPDRAQDGTATWSLTTLQRALHQAADGLPTISTGTILQILHDAGYTWQRNRTWCVTGQVKRKRKSGTVTVTDPDATAKKT
ncbi:MAG: helix-turn-helix domain containing protein [Oscillochloris sp.]|nr:helix-turn-helix domain containing protein [Oscillochloris sp.]